MKDLEEPLNTNVAEMDIDDDVACLGEVSKDCDMADGDDEDNGAEDDDDEDDDEIDEDSNDDDDDDKINRNNYEFLKRILKEQNKTMRFDELFAILINDDSFKESADGRNRKKCFIYHRDEKKSDEQNKRQALVQALDEFKELHHPIIFGLYYYEKSFLD